MAGRNWAFESQEFGAERSREANQYRIQQSESMQRGLSSLVPGFQQAQAAQLKNMQATNELGMDEIQRQEAAQSLMFAQELHRTKMSRAAAEAALSTAQLRVAQNEAAIKKLDVEGYSKTSRLTEEEIDDIRAAGFDYQMDGTHRGFGRVVEGSPEKTKAAKESKEARELRRAKLKGAAERLSYGDMTTEEFESFAEGKPGASIKGRPYAPQRPSSTRAAQMLRAATDSTKLQIKTLTDEIALLKGQIDIDYVGDPKMQETLRKKMAQKQSEIAELAGVLRDATSEALEDANQFEEETAGDWAVNALRMLDPSGGK